MLNIYIINESISNGFSYDVLYMISLLSIFCGIMVIISKNPIVSILFLIGLFLSIAGYLMMLGINFIGLSYLLVYVGAVSILFLFILMLINVRISELLTDNNNSIPLATMIGIIFSIALFKLVPSNLIAKGYVFNSGTKENYYDLAHNSLNYVSDVLMSESYYLYSEKLLFVSSSVWDSVLGETSHITSIGNILYTVYPLWLILTSIILLLAMVGAIVITIKQ